MHDHPNYNGHYSKFLSHHVMTDTHYFRLNESTKTTIPYHNPEKDTCLLSGEGLRRNFEELHGVSENNPKLHLFCLTSCMLNLRK